MPLTEAQREALDEATEHLSQCSKYACELAPRAVVEQILADQQEAIAQWLERVESTCPYEHKNCGHFACEMAQLVRRWEP